MEHKFNYKWTLKDANFTKDKGKVFSCFACGGGSTMGYKLAGFDVIGCNEIDKKMIEIYKKNHNPKYAFCEPIQEFKNKEELPEELFNLDILDGSPPCSTFSLSGHREDDWGKMRRFREGQAEQVLDTLFFDFIDLAKRLQPKVVVAENVKGLLVGDAKEYVRKIYQEFDNAGYYCQHFCLDASKMGVPQKRERVFFVCLRKDLAQPFLVQKNLFDTIPFIEMEFNEEPITFGECEVENSTNGQKVHKGMIEYFFKCENGKNLSTVCPKGSNYWFNFYKLDKDKVCPTLASAAYDKIFHYEKPEQISLEQWIACGTFPMDYNFLEDGKKKNDGRYVIGMSVPPVMMAQVASNIYEQWLSKM
jgi:DNA (cytosine-5)-methyltransferase 1